MVEQEVAMLAEGLHVLVQGERQINYELVYRRRKTLGIVVHPDGRVEVRAPEGARGALVLEKLARRAGWIVKQMDAFAELPPALPARRYVTGETIHYWGRSLRLRVVAGRRGLVRYEGQWLEVECRRPEQAERLVTAWLRAQGHRYVATLLAKWEARFLAVHGVQAEGVYFQAMERRWGSCTGRGRILLNPALVHLPKGCLEYVLVHELCHLVERGHGSAYWALLSREMGDWEKWRRRLARG